jgi:hypothetical protein
MTDIESPPMIVPTPGTALNSDAPSRAKVLPVSDDTNLLPVAFEKSASYRSESSRNWSSENAERAMPTM